MEVKLVLEEKPEPEQPTIWHAISAGLAVGFLGLVILAIPWSGFYKTQLNWHDSQGIAAFLAALSAYNCLSLLVRIQIIENAGTRWNDISDFHVAVAASALANILFWSGMAMWFVAADLNLSRFFCFITTALGAGGHVGFNYLRYKNNKSATTLLLLTVYGFILTGIVWAYATKSTFN